MKNFSVIPVSEQVIGYTPRYMGVNVEIQDHHDACNLWDWIADSGVSCVRTFHPEQTLRKEQVQPGRFGSIETVQDFHDWRMRVLEHPESDLIDWDNYLFTEQVPWMGTPDGFIGKINELGMQPLYSLGYATGHFEKPLIKDIEARKVPEEAGIDWEAAAVAYAYYFAVIYHYAKEFNGQYFMMINEPENRFGWFHLPEDLTKYNWVELFHDAPEETIDRYAEILACQIALLSRFARMAMEDVKRLLTGQIDGDKLMLTGPTTVFWAPLWEKSAEYLDALDYHHYHHELQTYPPLHQAAAQYAKKKNKMLAISEFNRYSGGTEIRHNLFGMEASLETGKLLMNVLGMTLPGDPEFHFAALYLLHFPSTHRNYKHLLYGDMNMVDWSGNDTPLWNRGKGDSEFGEEAWYPSFDEMQIRHITPAFAIFRMMNRAVMDAEGNSGPFEVLRTGMYNPTTSGPQDVHHQVQVQAIRQKDRMVINLMNPDAIPAPGCVVDLSEFGEKYKYASIRLMTQRQQDELIELRKIDSTRLSVDLPKRCMMQVILESHDLDQITEIEVTEESITPGDLTTGLSLHQTTRLCVMATLQGEQLDITDTLIQFESSDPQIIRVTGSGLVQRIRETPATMGAIVLTVKHVDGRILMTQKL